ncbi:MAG: hypothetical protein MPJ50_09730 [Pirellulales bacterium]|nr:hypothetical protein [Pirellulales bacterium]
MPRTLPALCAASALILMGVPCTASAEILIDFESTPSGVFPSYTEQGVTFTALGDGMLTSELFGNAPNGTRGLIGVPASDGEGGEGGSGEGGGGEGEWGEWDFPEGNPFLLELGESGFPGPGEGTFPGDFPALRADFDFVADFVCVHLGDDWADDDHIFLEVYDELGNSIGYVSSFPGADPGEMKELSILAPGIRFAIFGATGVSELGSSVFADNFRVRPVPESDGTVSLLLLIGLTGGAVVSWYRRWCTTPQPALAGK